MPAINSTVRESVQGFLNKRSVDHSVVCWPRLGVTPASSSSHFSIGVTSTATVGPKLAVRSLRFQLGAAPISITATSSASFFSSATAYPRLRRSDAAQIHLVFMVRFQSSGSKSSQQLRLGNRDWRHLGVGSEHGGATWSWAADPQPVFGTLRYQRNRIPPNTDLESDVYPSTSW